MFKKKKLYKFVYDHRNTVNWNLNCGRVLLVSARDATEAVEKLYKITKCDVGNITEFTEIKYGEGTVKNEEGK